MSAPEARAINSAIHPDGRFQVRRSAEKRPMTTNSCSSLAMPERITELRVVGSSPMPAIDLPSDVNGKFAVGCDRE